MVKGSEVPLESIFRDNSRSAAPSSGRSQSIYAVLQKIVSLRPTISLTQLESIKEAVNNSNLSYSEVVSLEAMARNRAASCERSQGWHAGFGDLVQFLTAIRNNQDAA